MHNPSHFTLPGKSGSCCTVFYHQDLIYHSYHWGPVNRDGNELNDDGACEGFDRNNAYQVLRLINEVLTVLERPDRDAGRKIERFIKIDLPYNIRSENKVKEYIFKNLKI